MEIEFILELIPILREIDNLFIGREGNRGNG